MIKRSSIKCNIDNVTDYVEKGHTWLYRWKDKIACNPNFIMYTVIENKKGQIKSRPTELILHFRIQQAERKSFNSSQIVSKYLKWFGLFFPRFYL